ncbi:MAG TPA: hydrogenase subunit MbhD domain-containing protein [Candidatus Izemoplasmatales bacterium]|nr:hydrogenase subunit MbhD domain-containing protein [Candidatus Izemoplasmatales bacterium]
MIYINALIIIFLIVCAFAIGRIKDLIGAVVLFSAYSLVMSILWLLLKSPDVAITEAAIGAGVTSILFFAVISKTKRYEK